MHVHAILYEQDVRKLVDGVYAVVVKHVGDEKPSVSEDQLESLVIDNKLTRIVRSKEEIVNGLSATKPFPEPKRIIAVYVPAEISGETISKFDKVDFSNEELVAYGLNVRVDEMRVPLVMIEFEDGELAIITRSEFSGEKAVKVSPMKKKKKKSSKGGKNARKARKRSKKSKAKSASA